MPGNLPAVAVEPNEQPTSFTYLPESASPPRVETPEKAPSKPRDYHFDLGVGTEAPISVGGILTAELPHRLLLQLGVGVLPSAYSDAIDSFLTKVGAYDTAVSAIVRRSMGNSLVLRASAGLRPFENHGFEMLGGYTLMTAGGSVATSDVLNAILVESGSSVQAPAGLGSEIPISATLHNVHATIGWRWLLADDRLVIRASISYIQTLSSHFAVTIPASASVLVPYQAAINEQINTFLGPYFSKYAKAPTLGLSAAFRF